MSSLTEMTGFSRLVVETGRLRRRVVLRGRVIFTGAVKKARGSSSSKRLLLPETYSLSKAETCRPSADREVMLASLSITVT